MNGADSLELILQQFFKDLANVTDTLALFGLVYVGSLTYKVITNAFYGFKVYVLPRFVSNDKWLRSLGSWAVVTGCTHGIGLAYAKELAKRNINLILIARNKTLLDKVALNFGLLSTFLKK